MYICVYHTSCVYIYVYHILYLSSVQNPGWLILEGFIHVHTTVFCWFTSDHHQHLDSKTQTQKPNQNLCPSWLIPPTFCGESDDKTYGKLGHPIFIHVFCFQCLFILSHDNPIDFQSNPSNCSFFSCRNS